MNLVIVCLLLTSVILCYSSTPHETKNNITTNSQQNKAETGLLKSINSTTNNSSKSIEKKKKSNPLKNTSYLAIYIITALFSISAYSIVLSSKYYKKRRPSSVFVFSLAIADLFIIIVLIPIKIAEMYGTWHLVMKYCRVTVSITLMGIGMASLNICVVSIDRFLFFASPSIYRSRVTVKKAMLMCGAAYLLSLITLLPIVKVGGQGSGRRPYCAFKFAMTKAFIIFDATIYFFLPTVIVTSLQISIMVLTNWYYRSHRQRLQKSSDGDRERKTMEVLVQQELRIQKMFLAIIIAFYICWGPFIVGMICNIYAQHLITPFFILFMRVLVFCNSFINPFIMIISNPKFRKMCNRRVAHFGTTTDRRATKRTSFFVENKEYVANNRAEAR